jgi:hypothetical protein
MKYHFFVFLMRIHHLKYHKTFLHMTFVIYQYSHTSGTVRFWHCALIFILGEMAAASKEETKERSKSASKAVRVSAAVAWTTFEGNMPALEKDPEEEDPPVRKAESARVIMNELTFSSKEKEWSTVCKTVVETSATVDAPPLYVLAKINHDGNSSFEVFYIPGVVIRFAQPRLATVDSTLAWIDRVLEPLSRSLPASRFLHWDSHPAHLDRRVLLRVAALGFEVRVCFVDVSFSDDDTLLLTRLFRGEFARSTIV